MPSKLLSILIALLLCLPVQSAALGQQPEISRNHHAWARYQPGAWKKVRVITETLDEQGRVTSSSITDTTTVLEDVTEMGFELRVEVSVEVAGKKFDAEPQYVTLGLFGEAEGQKSVVKPGEAATFSIEDRRIPCQIYTVETNGDDRKRVTKIFFANSVEPYLLRKESIATDPAGKNTLYETEETVVAVDMPFKVMATVMTASVVKVVRRNAKGSTVTIEVQAPQVPGGVVAHTSKELDSSGRVIRRSSLELVDYGLETDQRIIRRRPFQKRGRVR